MFFTFTIKHKKGYVQTMMQQKIVMPPEFGTFLVHAGKCKINVVVDKSDMELKVSQESRSAIKQLITTVIRESRSTRQQLKTQGNIQ